MNMQQNKAAVLKAWDYSNSAWRASCLLSLNPSYHFANGKEKNVGGMKGPGKKKFK